MKGFQTNLIDLLAEYTDFSDKSVMIGLSGGVNSMALLVYLLEFYPARYWPRALHLVYFHFRQHSPGTARFVSDGFRYARRRMGRRRVYTRATDNDVLAFFEQEKMIPHPTVSPCSLRLKVEPARRYAAEFRVDLDLVGYVREERKRLARQRSKGVRNKLYPVAHLSDTDCLVLCKQFIGWYPPIYDITKVVKGKRVPVFRHNNCLPCKNMTAEDVGAVRSHFPTYMERADQTAQKIGSYWGRSTELTKEEMRRTGQIPAFGVDDVPPLFQCEHCSFD